jgi:hypothetical protein
MKWYIATLKREFAKYGFIACPLSDERLTILYRLNVKLEEAYMIGCDVHCGFSFDEALEATA